MRCLAFARVSSLSRVKALWSKGLSWMRLPRLMYTDALS